MNTVDYMDLKDIYTPKGYIQNIPSNNSRIHILLNCTRNIF